MAKREWIRIGACAVVGLILGVVIMVIGNPWYFIPLGTFYAIGTFYGMKLILTALGGIGKTAGKSIFASIAIGQFFGCLLVIILILVAVAVVLSLGWVVGLFVAGKAMFDAYRTDSEISGPPTSGNNDWDDDKGASRNKNIGNKPATKTIPYNTSSGKNDDDLMW